MDNLSQEPTSIFDKLTGVPAKLHAAIQERTRITLLRNEGRSKLATIRRKYAPLIQENASLTTVFEEALRESVRVVDNLDSILEAYNNYIVALELSYATEKGLENYVRVRSCRTNGDGHFA